ncbi:MAG TPA: hypothetical protein ENK43_10640 [Planctomycetes bacterium]|nr:hypothetical protein [Planctomycetota bacterium]
MPLRILILGLWLTLPLLGQQQDFVIGIPVLSGKSAASRDEAFRRGAQMAAEDWNHVGGRTRVSLEVLSVDEMKRLSSAISAFKKSGGHALIAPAWDPKLLRKVTAAARRSKLPLLVEKDDSASLAATLRRILHERLRLDRTVVLDHGRRGPAKLAKPFRKLAGQACIDSFSLKGKAESIVERIRSKGADSVLALVDEKTPAEFLQEVVSLLKIPVFFVDLGGTTKTPALPRETYLFRPGTYETSSKGVAFQEAFAKKFGAGGPEAGTGYDALWLMVSGLAANSDRRALSDRMQTMRIEGVRGLLSCRAERGQLVFSPPWTLWTVRKGKATPLLPGIGGTGLTPPRFAKGARDTAEFGVPFGYDRSNAFELEKGTQWVVVGYGTPEESTIDEDLDVLGLSTRGASPLLDHLVKEELLARILAITSQKFLRNGDGTSIPGKSFRISFATHLPPKAKGGRMWRVVVAGDDPEAGGRAFPGSGLAKTFSTFLRRTIYEKDALDPKIEPDDLPYLLRSMEELAYDKLRMEQLQSLINGYAGGLALTTAHEVGHLAGLPHITSDPRGIMNVAEGGGLDHRLGRFAEESYQRLVQNLGLVPQSSKTSR